MRDGRRDQTVGDLFSAAAPYILPLIGFGILFGIGVAIGFVLIVIPGLILLTFWSVGAPAIVVEGTGPIDAFGRSWRLVRGNGLVGVRRAAGRLPDRRHRSGHARRDRRRRSATAASIVASIISAAITAPIYALAVSVLFFDLGGGAGVPDPAAAVAPPPPPPPPPASEPPPPAPPAG